MRHPFIRKSLVRTYLRYILPSLFAFTIGSIYGIVDGLFVGNIVGDAGLAAISVAWPIVQLALAVGTGLGMGGAVIASIRKGEGDAVASVRAMGTTLTLLLAAAVPLCLVVLLAGPALVGIMGADGETLVQAVLYVRAVAWGIPFYVIAMGALPLIRNRGAVKTAMAISVISGLVNVVLDWLFVVALGFGTAGAAWATVIGQGFGFVWALCVFAKKRHREVLRNLKPDFAVARHAIRLGIAPLGLSLLPELTTVVTNVNANAVGGEPAVAAFAVIGYIAIIVMMMIQGVGDGSQPLISERRGAGDFETMRRIRRTNYAVTLAIGAVGLAAMYVLRYAIPEAFGASEATVEIVAFALPLYSVSYVLYGFTHPSTSYFYATDDSRASNLMVYGEAVLVVVLITGLAWAVGLTGIWFSPIAIQMALAVLSFANVRKSDRRLAAR